MQLLQVFVARLLVLFVADQLALVVHQEVELLRRWSNALDERYLAQVLRGRLLLFVFPKSKLFKC